LITYIKAIKFFPGLWPSTGRPCQGAAYHWRYVERDGKRMTLIRVGIIGTVLTLLCACAGSSHENFKAHMDQAVGKRIDSPNTWARPDRFIKKEALPSGNMESEYKFRGTCRYFFEYEPSSLLIVGWHYEGKESDCEIHP
jgi:hypothetical protein